MSAKGSEEDEVASQKSQEGGQDQNEEEPEVVLSEEQLRTLGTAEQSEVFSSYPTDTDAQKLNVPYIEKQNGNILVKRDQNFAVAAKHYSKALFALSMLQKNENQIMPDEAAFQKYQKEIEIPASLNLGLAYLKIKDYPLSIKYCTQALDKESDNDKALYRRGMSYLSQGKIPQAKADLTRAFELTGGKDQNIIKALHQLKEKIATDKQKEKEMVKNIF